MTAIEPKPAPPSAAPAPPPVTPAPGAKSEVESAPPVKPTRTRTVVILGIIGVVVLVGLLAHGIMPRRTVTKQLAAGIVSADSALVIVPVAAAHQPTGPDTLVLPGVMEAMHEAAVYSRAAGYVRRWHADLGTVVRAGQLLADIDAPELEQNVLQARAQLAQMQSVLALARSNLERWRVLAADSAVTMQELQQMEQAYQAALASVHAAEANLRAMQTMLRYTQVRAPFEGVVVARNVDYGSLITSAGASSTPLAAGGSSFALPSTPSAASLYRVAQTDTMRVYVSIPQLYAASVQPGLTADVVIGDLGGRSFRGTVVRTSRAIDANTRTMLTEVDVLNVGHPLLPGMNAQVRITLRRVGAPLIIPSTALVVRAGGPQVMQLVTSGAGAGRDTTATVRIRNVQVARDNGSTVEIVSGLADSALVASIGTQILTEGQRVQIRRPGDATRAAAARPPVTSVKPSPATTRDTAARKGSS